MSLRSLRKRALLASPYELVLRLPLSMLLQSFRQVGDRVVTRFVLPMILVRVGFGSAKRMAGGGKYFVNEGVVNVNRAVVYVWQCSIRCPRFCIHLRLPFPRAT